MHAKIKYNSYLYIVNKKDNQLKDTIMAKYTINHKCGHSVEVQLYGKYEDRERRIAWLEDQECEQCRREKATESAKERGLADLEGTEKQIAWANTIRGNAYKALDSLKQFAQNDPARAMVEVWSGKMGEKKSAKWWIDNRYNLPGVNASPRETVAMLNDLLK